MILLHYTKLGSGALVAAGVALLLGSMGIQPPAQAATAGLTPLPAAYIDNDRDGIDDALEQMLAERYAPVIFIEPDESNYPVNVEWFLRRAHLQYHEDCTFDKDEDVPSAPNPLVTQDNLIGPPWAHPDSWGPGHLDSGDQAHCGQTDTGYSHPPHRRITTTAADPDGQVEAGAATTGYSDQQTFLLPDLADSDHLGSTDPRDWVSYFHAYPTADGGIMLQYWHVFAYNHLAVAGFGDHGGDWDATIHVQLDPSLNLRGIWFSRHANDHPGDFMVAGSPQLSFFGGTHPLMTIDGGGHAAYASPGDYCDHRAPVSTASWPSDPNDPANPDKLQEVLCGFFSGPVQYIFGGRTGGITWQTWTGGEVRSGASLTHPISAPSGHGGLINLGEYNPCVLASDAPDIVPVGTPVTCNGSKQASSLLAGQFHPLNGQSFIRYSGRWGNLPNCDVKLCATPPRGPVFQGWDEGQHTYTAWYNQASNKPASATSSPWRQPPSTALTIGGPSYTPGPDLIYVSGKTTFSLAASQSSIAAQYGAQQTFYRFYRIGSPPPAYATYIAPFSLIGPDGTYQIDYYSLDALNNVEITRSRVVTLDATPPIISGAPTTKPNSQGWYNAPVTVHFTCDDALSGMGSCPGDVTLGTEGAKQDVSAIATDRVGNTAVTTVGGLSIDRTPPVLTVPDSVTVDASSPAGAGVTYATTATDTLSGPSPVGCNPPSGTTFSIGTTTVTCTVSDAAGNTATRSFPVKVNSAAEQLTNLVGVIQSFKLKQGIVSSLDAKLTAAQAAQAAAGAGDRITACNQLSAFINEVQAQSGKELTLDQAVQLAGSTKRIQAVLGCG